MSRPAPSAPPDAPGVVQIRDALRAGRTTPRAAVEACLARIAARDGAVRAFVELAAEAALAEASAPADGPLSGVPFAVKDVLDVAGMTTRMGSRAGDPRPAARDAGCVGLARLAGAIPLGKTVTAEFAGTQPTPVLNPAAPSRTPGGSSSGSAAAVADGMVPFAFGTQTGGSVLRPAAFCGIVGFKPSFGLYPVAGMKPAAHSFDTVGVLTRSVGDAAAVHAALAGDAEARAAEAPPVLGLFRSHLDETVEPETHAAMEAAVARLSAAGARVVPVDPPPGFARITGHRAVINAYERARDLAGEWRAARDLLCDETRAVCERGFAIPAADYLAARAEVDAFRHAARGLLDGVDALLTPTTPGPAPEGHAWAGDPRLQELWTMLHLPSLSLPLPAEAPAPLGLQMVGARYADRALLAAALWVEGALA